MFNNWTIIYTYHNQPIHIDYLKKSNPKAKIICANIEYGISDKKYAWRNCDYLVRKWLQENITKIETDRVAILQWDVLVNKQLPDIQPKGLLAPDIQIPNTRFWVWFKETYKLNEYKDHAIGATPFAFLMMNHNAIEKLIDPRHDQIFEQDIFCELRFPTILNSVSVEIESYSMPNITEFNIKPNLNKPDFYHSVKISY